MSAWLQAGAAVMIAVAAYLWLRTSMANSSDAGKRISWMPKALFLVSVGCAVGISLSKSVMYVWETMAVITVLAVLFRVFVVPRLRDKPKTLQTMVEVGVKSAQSKEKSQKNEKRKRWMLKGVFLISVWFAFGRILVAIYGMQSREINIEIFAKNVTLFGLPVSSSVLTVWLIIAVTAVLAVLFRGLAVPHFREKPKGLQNLVEMSIEGIDKYTHGKMHAATDALACYMFTIALLMVGSALVEVIGLRPPMADLKMTLSMALITFVFINYYGIKEKGIGGRVRSLMQPSPVILPIKILTDFAIPVSLACRLFGNMIGGLIVMDLLKIALGANGIGLPSVVGLYFNVFHPLIQAYIFVTLSLTFINEAAE